MKNLFKVFAGLLLLLFVVSANAQTGQLQSGQVWGNSTAAKAPASGTTLDAILSRVGGVGSTLINFLQYGTGATSRTAQSKMRDTFSVLDYIGASSGNCVANSTNDCAPAINAAIAAASAYAQSGASVGFFGAKVYLPSGPSCYRIASTIVMAKNVSLVGDKGLASCIYADNVNAITMTFTSGGGNLVIEGISILGVNASAARTAIKRSATAPTNSDDSMSGLTIRDVYISNFDTAISLFTVQSIEIDNVQATSINQGIVITGFGGAGAIKNVKLVKLSGGGTGGVTFTGIDFVPTTYVSGATIGTFGPEGLVIANETSVNGFAIGVNFQQGNWFTIRDSDVTATVSGIKYGLVGDGLLIDNNYIVMRSNAAVAGIYGVGQATVPNTFTIIKNNVIQGDGTTTTADGVRINDVGTFNQYNVTVESNQIKNLTGYDVAIYNPGGKNRIADNRCASTGNTGSILVGTIVNGLTTVEGNICGNTITNTTAGDLTSGAIRWCNNYQNGTADKICNWGITTNNTTANRVMLGGGAGSQPSALGAGTTTTVLHGNAGGAPSFGAVSLTADVSGVAPIANGGTGAALTKLAWSATAPTILSGFCTSPSISSNNGTVAFTITIGSACGASTGVLTMAAATTGWACNFRNVTNSATSAPAQTASTTTSVSVTNYVRTTGVAGNWTASDVIVTDCVAY